MANIPRSFLPCAGLDPAASSQDWEDRWEDRRSPHQSWSQSPSRALCSTQRGPPLPTRLPAKLCKHSSSSGRAGDRDGRDKVLSALDVAEYALLLVDFLPQGFCSLIVPQTTGLEGFLRDPCGSQLHFPFAKSCPIFILLLLRTPRVCSPTAEPQRQCHQGSKQPDNFSDVTHVCIRSASPEGNT